MFATLNLQLSSLDLSSEMLETPVVTPETSLDFARLLQLSATQPDDVPGGDLLPQGGSELPLQPLSVSADLPPAVDLRDLELPVVGAATEPEAVPRVLVEAQLRIPAADEDMAVVLAAPATAPAAPVPRLASGEGLTTELTTPVTRPSTTTAASQPMVAPGERELDVPIPARREPAVTVTQAAPARVDAETLERIVPVDQPRRPEAPLPATVVEAASDAPKARPVVNQLVQVLTGQPNPQPPQPIVTAAPTAAADGSYAAVAQQAGEAIPTAVRDPAWGDQIGERVVLMAGNQVRTAEIRLTPAELGPLRVQVSVEDGAAHVTFQAQHAATREAIEQALPRLRELLAENGLSLGQANVGEQGVAGRQRDDAPAAPDTATDVEESPENIVDDEAPVASSRGLVDTFV